MSEIVLRHKRFGLTHPTWDGPACFYYDSAAEAEARIRKTYGDNSGHLIVEVLWTTPATEDE